MKKCLSIIITVFCLLAFESTSHAIGRRIISGGCSTGTCAVPSTNYNYATEITPAFAYPILVPAYQFQYVPPAYAAPVVPVIPVTGYPVATPIIQPVTALPYGIGGVQPTYPMQPTPQYPNVASPNVAAPPIGKDKIRELARAIIEEMARQTESDSGPPVVPGTPVPQPQQPQPPQPQPQPSNPALLAQTAVTALNRACYACHTGVGSRKDTVIFTQPGLLNQNANWSAIKAEVKSGRMPPKDHQYKLTPQEKGAIVEWLTSQGVQ